MATTNMFFFANDSPIMVAKPISALHRLPVADSTSGNTITDRVT